jgi:molybdopterin-synthase adenylyltransferase
MLSKEEGARYIRQIMLQDFGLDGQLLLKKAKVALVGAGGLGCPAALYLASCGVGTLGLIDHDTVDASNLHRQILYTPEDLEKKKTEAASAVIRRQNPFVTVVAHDVLLGEQNVEELLGGYDLVIDGSDNFATRYIVNDACVKLSKPLVYGSILNMEGQLAVFNYKGSKHLRDIFPEPPNPGEVPDCSENGVLGIVPGIIGTLLANEAIKVITGRNIQVNALFIVNLASLEIRKIIF